MLKFAWQKFAEMAKTGASFYAIFIWIGGFLFNLIVWLFTARMPYMPSGKLDIIYQKCRQSPLDNYITLTIGNRSLL